MPYFLLKIKKKYFPKFNKLKKTDKLSKWKYWDRKKRTFILYFIL